MFETVEYINVHKTPELSSEHKLHLGTALANQPIDPSIKLVDVKNAVQQAYDGPRII